MQILLKVVPKSLNIYNSPNDNFALDRQQPR